MTAHVLVDETLRIAWQGDGELVATLTKWLREGGVRSHFSDDSQTTLLINWGLVRSVRLGEHGEALRR